MAHWHVDKLTLQAEQAPGQPGECCEGYATWADLFGGMVEAHH